MKKTPFKTKPCSECGSDWHIKSFHKLRKPLNRVRRMRPESLKTKARRLSVREQWFKLNPADKDGMWTCYLHISPRCPKKLVLTELVLEHYESKARRRDLKFEVSNLKPACSFCNEIKGSRSGSEFGA